MSTRRLVFALVITVTGPACLTAAEPTGLVAGQGDEGPWWMRQTAISRDGDLSLVAKPWWPRAKQLAVGASFVVPGTGETEGRMLVRRPRR